MNKEFDFAKEFGSIDEELVESAGKEWAGQKHSVFQLYSRRIACAALILVLGFAVASNSRIQAAVKGVTTKIGEMLGYTKDLSSYTEIMNQTQTQNGVTLTLKEVIVDDRVLMVSVYTDSTIDGEAPSLWLNEEETLINDKHYRVYDSMTGWGRNPEESGNIILTNTYEEQILPDGDVKVHLVLEAGESIPFPKPEFKSVAEFVYDFVINTEELKAQTIHQNLDITVSGPGEKTLQLQELTMNDLYCRILATGVAWDDEWVNEYNLKLKGTDSLGNPVSFDGMGFLSGKEMRFVSDFWGNYEWGMVIDENDFRVPVPDKNCDYLDLQLYERKMIIEDIDITELKDEDVYIEDVMEVWEEYAKQENYGWVPVGEPFRITITHD